MKASVALVLCLCFPAMAIADDGLILEQGAELESAQRMENATAAGLTAGLLGFESFEGFEMAREVKPGGLIDLSEIDRAFDYTIGAVAALGSVSMLGLLIHDVIATPVADARDAYQAGDHSASWHLADREVTARPLAVRAVVWTSLVLDTGLAAYGLSQLGNERSHDAGVADIWVGGTCALVSATILLHLREPAAAHTHRQLAVSASPRGIALAGAF